MKPKSGKAKGRRFQNWIRECIIRWFDLSEDDVKTAVMGEKGRDLHLSEAAQRVFPYSVEAKNVERLNVWSAFNQAENNCGDLIPLLLIRRNRSKVLAVLDFDAFMDLHARSIGE